MGRRAAFVTDTVWICRPGQPSRPCTTDLDTTEVHRGGVRTRTVFRPAASPPADCFYIYPTVSTATGDNAPRASSPEITDTIHAQAALFSSVCRVFAPAYQQVTTGALLRGRYLDPAIQQIAYDDVRSAWRDHLLSAILLGANVTVATGRPVGGSFTTVPACTAAGQKGCVIAYSSFASPPPSYSLFGRTNNGGQQVLCTDPSRLAGGSGPTHPYLPAGRITAGPKALPGTGFVTYPDAIRVACRSGGGATWLQVSVVLGSGLPTFQEPLGPAWGLHIADVSLALGDLVEAVRRQEAG